MSEYWIVYDLVTGADLWRGSGSAGSAAVQQLPEGAGLVIVPQQVIDGRELDLAALRAALANGIDTAAEQVRARFVTALPAQIGTYVLKEAAARRWLADDQSPTWMLAPEAASRGMTIAALAAEVIANAEAWEKLSGAIEGLRFAAKERVVAAPTIGLIAQAALVDWTPIYALAA